jgi:beta-galactosidase
MCSGAWSTVVRCYRLAEPHAHRCESDPLLDFRRFMSDEVASFHREQIEVLREHAPHADLLHNFMGFFTTFDHYEFAER